MRNVGGNKEPGVLKEQAMVLWFGGRARIEGHEDVAESHIRLCRLIREFRLCLPLKTRSHVGGLSRGMIQ